MTVRDVQKPPETRILANYLAQAAGSLRLVREDKEGKIPERLLAKLWKDRAARQTSLRTGAGKAVRVVYPGRAGTAAGPDFRDALLEVEGLGLVCGDVELHIRQQDWDSHGHGGDPNYNGVVFHGALEVRSAETRLQSGSYAPVVSLQALLEEEPECIANGVTSLDLWEVLAGKGYPKPGSIDEVGEALDRAGDQRFLLKSQQLLEDVWADGPDQALYQALMEGLGYSSNRRPFMELASRAPYQAVVQAARELPLRERAPAIRGWLGACSGLEASEQSRPRGFGSIMNQEEWHLFRVRPANHPRRRIWGAALVLARFLEQGLAAGLAAVATGSSPAKLTQALSVSSTEGPAFIGPGRARDLAVNAVLPFTYGWHQAGGPVEKNALALYHRYPRLPGNELVREMTEQLLPPEWWMAVNNARRQQGLLHLSALLRGAY